MSFCLGMVKFSQGRSKAWHDTQKKLQGAATSRDDANYICIGPDFDACVLFASIADRLITFPLLCGTLKTLSDS